MQAYWLSLGDDVRDLGLLPVLLSEGGRALGAARLGLHPARAAGTAGPRSRGAGTCAASSVTARARARTRRREAVDTEATELGIACEACHGPGGRARARERPQSAAPLPRSTSPTAATTRSCSRRACRRSARSRSAASATGSSCPRASSERIRLVRVRATATGPATCSRQSGRIVLRGGAHASDPEIVRARADLHRHRPRHVVLARRHDRASRASTTRCSTRRASSVAS